MDKEEILALYNHYSNEELDKFIFNQIKRTSERTNIFNSKNELNPAKLELHLLFSSINKTDDFYDVLMDYLWNESKNFKIIEINNGYLNPSTWAISKINKSEFIEELLQNKNRVIS